MLAVNSSSDSLSFFFPCIFDPQLNLVALVNSLDLQAVQEGASLQFDQSGALLYAVLKGVGVDIIEARSGQLRERLSLSEQILTGGSVVSQIVSKVMAITPGGDQIFLLTNAGLTVADLDAVPLGIGSVSPVSGRDYPSGCTGCFLADAGGVSPFASCSTASAIIKS